MITTAISEKLVFPIYHKETLLFQPKSKFSCSDVIPDSEEVGWFTRLRSPVYRVRDTVCRMEIRVQINWSFDFPKNESAMNKLFRGDTGTLEKCDSSSTDLKELLFDPKPGFSCADWPQTRELSFSDKPLPRMFDEICCFFVRPKCEELLINWPPKRSTAKKIARFTLRGKTYRIIL